MRTGKIKVLIDQAEHEAMDGLFADANKTIGILDVERKVLPFGDYWLKAEGERRFVFTFKELEDFRNSFFSGHLQQEIIDIYAQADPTDIKALILANNEFRRTDTEIHKWVGSHWRKRNFVIPTFKFESREKAVAFMIDCAMTGSTIDVIERPFVKPADDNEVMGVYAWYGVGASTAKALIAKYPIPITLFLDMMKFREWNELTQAEFGTKKNWRAHRWWSDIDGLGEKRALQIETLILEGKPIPRSKRGGE